MNRKNSQEFFPLISKAQRKLNESRPLASAFGAFGTSWAEPNLVEALLSLALEGEAGEGVLIPHYEERFQMSLVLISADWSVELGQTCEAARNGKKALKI